MHLQPRHEVYPPFPPHPPFPPATVVTTPLATVWQLQGKMLWLFYMSAACTSFLQLGVCRNSGNQSFSQVGASHQL